MNSLAMNEQETKEMEKNLNEAFTGGVAVYNGYVDDIRNTDNAWMETVSNAVNTLHVCSSESGRTAVSP